MNTMRVTDDATALLFPGQGSQSPGMRDAVERHRPELLELCEIEVGCDPFQALDSGTRCVQPALFCASVAAWAAAGSPRPRLLAGHSLGELAALTAAGCISEADGLRLAALRGRVMQEAADANPGGMVAVLGGEPEDAQRLAAEYHLTLANDNAPGQVVLSGPVPEVEAVSLRAKRAGLRVRRLPIAGAFHSPAMAPAVSPYARALHHVDFAPPKAKVFSGVTAAPFDDCRQRLAQALTEPVRWRETVLAMQRAGVRRFVEVGPGHVLRNLVKRIAPDAEATTLEELEVATA
jgi:malonyl CoA-acyl carrier protein transacylase